MADKCTNAEPLGYSVVIVSYRRAPVLHETLRLLLPLCPPHGEVIVVEQRPDAPLPDDVGRHPLLRYVTLDRPSMVGARNHGLALARGAVVIFLDDDVLPYPGLIEAHLAAYDVPHVGGVAGRILDEGQVKYSLPDSRLFDTREGWRYAHFDHTHPGDVMTARGCNMSFRRELLLRLGGFDPFLRMWRDETDVCFRVRGAGYAIRFVPAAALVHLGTSIGGTRPARATTLGLWSELRLYAVHHRHYRDNLYFILKHFQAGERRRWVLDAYRTYVGLSRWPWRLVAKNICFWAALAQAWLRARRPPKVEALFHESALP
jgi:GT2 family glycosyltransferase